MSKNSILDNVDNIKDYLINIRRNLHKNPEIQFNLDKTCTFVKSELEKMGLEVNSTYGKSSLTTVLQGSKPGKTIALRADMDALHILEETDVAYKSINKGIMHACGHDGHTAMLLGTAKILSNNKNLISGNVRFIFQACEEGPESGAKCMIEDGILNDVDTIFGMHLTNELEKGTVGINSRKAMASATRFNIEIIGKGGHAGSPHKAIDAIAIASQIISNIQFLVSREMNPLEPLVVNIGTIEGGSISNAVAEKVKLSGTIRSYSTDITNFLKNRISSIVKNAIEPLGGTYNIRFNDGVPPLINDKNLVLEASKSIIKVVGDNNLSFLENPKMGSEDFAYYLKNKPGCYIWLGSGNKDKGLVNAHHNPKYNFDEDALVIGTKIFVQYVLDQLKNSKE